MIYYNYVVVCAFQTDVRKHKYVVAIILYIFGVNCIQWCKSYIITLFSPFHYRLYKKSPGNSLQSVNNRDRAFLIQKMSTLCNLRLDTNHSLCVWQSSCFLLGSHPAR